MRRCGSCPRRAPSIPQQVFHCIVVGVVVVVLLSLNVHGFVMRDLNLTPTRRASETPNTNPNPIRMIMSEEERSTIFAASALAAMNGSSGDYSTAPDSSSSSSPTTTIAMNLSTSPLPPGVQVRHAQAKDLKVISNIVTDAFFGRFNPLEWLKTFLSLEDSLPLADKSELYDMLVAYDVESGEIVGFCEVDCRPTSKPNAAPRPYMCNLAIKDSWRKRGIGSALITICEDRVVNGWFQEYLFLRVRKNNSSAVRLYEKLGYEIDVNVDLDTDASNNIGEENIMLLKKRMKKKSVGTE